ncbi:MAG: hypothetical protein KGK07_16465 [Chloroflexota bacterium]|nr:hypothetical protein [Chloroflexota bacterium]
MTATKRSKRVKDPGTVYLLHFDRAYKHARHYLGWTTDLEARLRRHRGEGEKDGRGSRLVEIVMAAGIDFEVARLWRGDRHLERRIKGRGLAAYCPICSQRPRRPVGAVEVPLGDRDKAAGRPARGSTEHHERSRLLVPPSMRATQMASGPIAVLPLGPVSASEIDLVEEVVGTLLGARALRLPELHVPASYFDVARGQFDADQLLELLFDMLPDGALRIVGVLDSDMFAVGRTFVFGYAHLHDGVAVYSTARLREEWYGHPTDEAKQRSRSYRALAHEFGHTFGNPHCKEATCVMHAVSQVESLDSLGPSYCAPCLRRVRQGLTVSPTSAEGRFLRAGALRRRRYLPRAIQTYREAVQRAPLESRYHNDLGVALLAVSDRAGARAAFHRASELSPDFPHPYYNLGILCREDGGVEMAERWFAEGLRRDRDPLAAHRYLGRLYEDLFNDASRARRHYTTYLEMRRRGRR